MATTDTAVIRVGQRWLPAAGIVSALLFVATVALIGDIGGTASESATKLSERKDALVAAFVTGTLSMLALLAFFAWLNELIRATVPHRTVLARLSLTAATCMAALLPGSLAILAGVAQAGKDTELSPAVAAFAVNTQFPFLAAGVMFGGLAVFCAMVALKGTGAVPDWLCWSGLVVGVLGLASFAFLPIPLWFLWLLVAGIVLTVRRPRAAG